MLATDHKAAGARLCRALALALFALPAWADLWVTVAGAGTQDGSSLANACAGGTGGTSDTDCTTFTDGQAVHYCGAFTTILTIPNAGTNASSVNVYTGSCPGGTNATITTASGAAINQNKAFTTVEYFTLNPAGITTSDRGIILAANDITAQYNTITGGGRSIEFGTAATRARVTVRGNTIRDSELNPIVWSYACASAFDFDDITIDGNFLYDNGRAVSKPNGITLQYTANTAGCEMHRIAVTNNYIEGQGGNAITIDHATDAVTNEDVTVTGNECGPGNDGCIAVHSFGSSTSDYGKNIIANNIIRGTLGDAGGINVFYSQYLDIYDNFCEDLSTDNIDGNCILIDHGNDNVRVFRNWGDGMLGDAGADNSGVGLMILDSTNVHAFANIFRNVKSCFWFSGETTESGNVVENNSCAGATAYGARVQAAADADSLIFRNNALSDVATGISAEAGGNTQTFSNNAISATTDYDLNSVFTTADDVLGTLGFIGGRNPSTAEGFRLSASSPGVAAGDTCATSDYFGDAFYSSCDIGAFRRDSCYRRSRDGKLDMARTRSQVVSRCLGVPGRYPEGL